VAKKEDSNPDSSQYGEGERHLGPRPAMPSVGLATCHHHCHHKAALPAGLACPGMSEEEGRCLLEAQSCQVAVKDAGHTLQGAATRVLGNPCLASNVKPSLRSQIPDPYP
jgi:hypothetical protein